MIEITDKTKCCGCGACHNICPTNAISVRLDEEGFRYPIVNKELCAHCKKCVKICPVLTNYKRNKNFNCSFYGAYNKDKQVIKCSSSGGIFWPLAKYILDCGGTVYGVELGANFHLRHNRAKNYEECQKFKKSKYLESDTNTTYKLAKEDLQAGLKVLYSGTPCQIAGLYSFLNKEYKNLYTCDVVCHGVPSRTVFNKYIDYINALHSARALSACWRDKQNGWRPNRVSINFDNGKTLTTTSMQTPYQNGFLSNLYLRPSCYECPWAALPRVGDISLADFWGYKGKLNENNKNLGLSAVIISSAKGKELLESIKDGLIIEKTTRKYLTFRSRHVHMPPAKNKQRAAFFKDFKEHSFEFLYKKYIASSLWKEFLKLPLRIYSRVWRSLKK